MAIKSQKYLCSSWIVISQVLLVIVLNTPKFGWSASILLQKTAVKIADTRKQSICIDGDIGQAIEELEAVALLKY